MLVPCWWFESIVMLPQLMAVFQTHERGSLSLECFAGQAHDRTLSPISLGRSVNETQADSAVA